MLVDIYLQTPLSSGLDIVFHWSGLEYPLDWNTHFSLRSQILAVNNTHRTSSSVNLWSSRVVTCPERIFRKGGIEIENNNNCSLLYVDYLKIVWILQLVLNVKEKQR